MHENINLIPTPVTPSMEKAETEASTAGLSENFNPLLNTRLWKGESP